MSTHTRPRTAAGVPVRRRTVTRRPLRRPNGETPATETPATETPATEAPATEAPATGTAARTVRSGAPARERARRAFRRPDLLVTGLAVALVAAVVAAGFAGYSWYAKQQVDDAHQQALAAARQTTVNFVSVSAATVDRDLKRVTDGATGDFKDEFTRGAPQVRAAVVENKVDSHGSVLRAALVSGDKDSAVVLVAVDATVKNAKAPQGRLSHYRIQVNMTKDAQSGRWLVSKLQFVG